jgi:hypothetical protein
MDNLWIIGVIQLASLYQWAVEMSEVWQFGGLAGRPVSRLSRGCWNLRFTPVISYGNSYADSFRFNRSWELFELTEINNVEKGRLFDEGRSFL